MLEPLHLSRPALTVVAKWPNQGQVKTRLAQAVGLGRAVELHRAFLRDVLEHMAPLARENIDLILSVDGLSGDPKRLGAGSEYRIEPQGSGDLGERMARNFQRRLVRERRPAAVLIGSDLPSLPAAPVRQALRTLQQVPMVLGPTGDGGYYLIGLSRPVRAVFRDIPWSTSKVQKATLNAAQSSGVPVSMVQAWDDVDTPSDLARLQQELRRDPTLAPHTAQILLDIPPLSSDF